MAECLKKGTLYYYIWLFYLQNEVIDLDIGDNKNHTFEQSRPLSIYPDSLRQSVGSNAFRFFSNGTVKTNTYFQANMNGYFLMSVRARDKDGQTANASLRVGNSDCLSRQESEWLLIKSQVNNISAISWREPVTFR